MKTTPCGIALPRGVSFDPVRQRYRVRLYRFQREVWLTYPRTHDDALADFAIAKAKQNHIKNHRTTIRGVGGYVNALQKDLV